MTQSQKYDFSDYIADHTRDFYGREWVFMKINQWLDTPNAPQYFIIIGEPGIGKTALAARLTQRYKIAAYHFCIIRDSETRDPRSFVRSIFQQLLQVRDFPRQVMKLQDINIDINIHASINYGEIVGVKIDNMINATQSAEEMFNSVILDPLRNLSKEKPEQQFIIIVDALDEAMQFKGEVSIIDLLANAGKMHPAVRFILTSRPDEEVLRHLERRSISFLLDGGCDENYNDVYSFVRKLLEKSAKLREKLKHRDFGDFINTLAKASKGNFLYLNFVLQAIDNDTLPVDKLGELPPGLDSIYLEYLRTRVVGKSVTHWRDRFRPFLGFLASAQAPINEEQLAHFANLELQDIKDLLFDARQFINPGLFSKGLIRLFHESFVDFLSRKEHAQEFWIDFKPFHQRIADYYLDHFKQQWNKCDLYGIRNIAYHLVQAGFFEQFQELMLDFPWLQARLEKADIYSLLADYRLTSRQRDAEILYRTLLLSSNVLSSDKHQLAGQLLGRLPQQSTKRLQAIRKQIKQNRGYPWLHPLTTSLTEPKSQLLNTLIHRVGIDAAIILSNGKRAITALDNGFLFVWDLEIGKKLTKLPDVYEKVVGFMPSTDKRKLYIVDGAGRFDEWDLENPEMLQALNGRTIQTPKRPHLHSYILEGNQITDLQNRQIFRRICTFNVVEAVSSKEFAMSVAENCRRALFFLYEGLPTDSNKYIMLVDLERSEVSTLYENWYDRWVSTVALTPDSSIGFVGGHKRGWSREGKNEPGIIDVWDIESRSLIRTIVDEQHKVTKMSAMPDGHHILYGTDQGTLILRDFETGEIKGHLTGHQSPIDFLQLSSDGQRALSASRDGDIKLWNINKQRKIATYHVSSKINGIDLDGQADRAIVCMSGQKLHVWNLGKPNKGNKKLHHNGAIYSIIASQDGNTVISVSDDGTARVWDSATGDLRLIYRGHKDRINAVGMSIDGLKAISVSRDNCLKIWNTVDGSEYLSKGLKYPGSDQSSRYHVMHLGPTSDEKFFVVFWNDTKCKEIRNENSNEIMLSMEGVEILNNLDGTQGDPTKIKIIYPESFPGIVATSNLEREVLKNKDGDILVHKWNTKVSEYSENILIAVQHFDYYYHGENYYNPKYDEAKDHGANTALAISPSGKYAACGFEDGSLILVDLDILEQIAGFWCESTVKACTFCSESTLVAGDEAGRIHFLRLEET